MGKRDEELACLLPLCQELFINCAVTDEQVWNKEKEIDFLQVIAMPGKPARKFEMYKVPIFDEQRRRQAMMVVGGEITERLIADVKL